MDPRLYDLQAALDASIAMAQQGNEGTSGSERVVVDVTNTAAAEQDELQLAIRASVETFQKEDLRKKGDFWHNFDSPVREWNKNNQPPKIEHCKSNCHNFLTHTTVCHQYPLSTPYVHAPSQIAIIS